jgi:hypothetical protein
LPRKAHIAPSLSFFAGKPFLGLTLFFVGIHEVDKSGEVASQHQTSYLSMRLQEPPKMSSQTFRARDVCAAIGLPPGTLSSWKQAGALRNLTGGQTSQGKARRFTVEDVTRLAITKAITETGIAIESAANWAGFCVNYMDNWGEAVTEFNILFYENDLVLRANDDLMTEPAAPGAYARFTIYPWKIVDRLKVWLGAIELITIGAGRPLALADSVSLGAPKRAPNRRRKPKAA